jgi:hypothetical protein
MAFRVGQKVVCVNDEPSRFTGFPTNVKKGGVYTITKTFLHPRGVPCVLLKEIEVPRQHLGYDASRFRPVGERKTDISIFTAMLNPSKEHVRS